MRDASERDITQGPVGPTCVPLPSRALSAPPPPVANRQSVAPNPRPLPAPRVFDFPAAMTLVLK